MRDSGVEWLGEIPRYWEKQYARWLFREVDERSDTGEGELLTVSHLTGVTLRSEKDVNMFMAETLEGYKICQPGDLVINTLWAWMGAMGVAFQRDIVSPACLDKEIAKLDSLNIAAQGTIKLLQERRATLISAAVTGQICVGVEPCGLNVSR